MSMHSHNVIALTCTYACVVPLCACMYMAKNVEVREQLMGVGSFRCMDPGDRTEVLGLSGKCLHLLSHLPSLAVDAFVHIFDI